jgi:AcrR family transcriptional regulator
VARNQRDRLAAGMIAAVAEDGYNGATISQIASAAGVSRRTFYTYFSSKEECFLDTYGQIDDFLAEAMEVAGPDQEEWAERVRAKLLALVTALAANPLPPS